MSQENWDLALCRVRFSKADICLQDFPKTRDHLSGVLVTTAVGPSPQVPKIPTTAILVVAGPTMQYELALQLQCALHTTGSSACEVVSVKDLEGFNLESRLYFFLPELEASFPTNADAVQYSRPQKLTTTSRNLFWLTQKDGTFVDHPDFCLVTGLQRCLRLEKPSSNIVVLVIDRMDSSAHITNMVMTAFEHTFLPNADRVVERSFAEQDVVLYISRMFEASYPNSSVAAQIDSGRAQPHQIPQANVRPLGPYIASPFSWTLYSSKMIQYITPSLGPIMLRFKSNLQA